MCNIVNSKLNDLLLRYYKLSNEYRKLNEQIEIQRNNDVLNRLNSKILDTITEMKTIQNELDRRGIKDYKKIFV
jgi:hypothetical protein